MLRVPTNGGALYAKTVWASALTQFGESDKNLNP